MAPEFEQFTEVDRQLGLFPQLEPGHYEIALRVRFPDVGGVADAWFGVVTSNRVGFDVVGTLPVIASGDVIHLKNGNTLQGEIESTNEQEVTVNIPGLGRLTVRKDEIVSIENSPSGKIGKSKSGDAIPNSTR